MGDRECTGHPWCISSKLRQKVSLPDEEVERSVQAIHGAYPANIVRRGVLLIMMGSSKMLTVMRRKFEIISLSS